MTFLTWSGSQIKKYISHGKLPLVNNFIVVKDIHRKMSKYIYSNQAQSGDRHTQQEHGEQRY